MLKENKVQIISALGALVSAWCLYQVYKTFIIAASLYGGIFADAPYYIASIIFSIFGAAVILRSIYGKVNVKLKWLAFSSLLIVGLFFIICFNMDRNALFMLLNYFLLGSLGNIAALIGCFRIRK